MIHQLLTLTRPLFIMDTETTGTNTETARIIELGFEQWSDKGIVKEWRTLVNPGVPIPAGSTEIHHITDAMVTGCKVCGGAQKDLNANFCTCEVFAPWPTFRQLAKNLAYGFRDCDFAGQNIRFDLRVITAEMKRANVCGTCGHDPSEHPLAGKCLMFTPLDWNYAGARIIDSGRLEQLVVPRTLSDLHKKYTGLEHDGAHGALSDVRASHTVIVKQLETYESLPRDLAALHELSWPGWITADGGVRFVNGVATMMFGKHKEKALQDVPRDYWDYVLRPKESFGEDMKRIAAEAKLGRYPKCQ